MFSSLVSAHTHTHTHTLVSLVWLGAAVRAPLTITVTLQCSPQRAALLLSCLATVCDLVSFYQTWNSLGSPSAAEESGVLLSSDEINSCQMDFVLRSSLNLWLSLAWNNERFLLPRDAAAHPTVFIIHMLVPCMHA